MTRNGRIVSWLILAGVLLGGLRPIWTIDPDAAAYVSLARELASGHGYVLDGMPHAKYPPGLPLFFATIIRFAGPGAYGWLHAGLVAVFLAAVVLTHRLVRRLGYAESIAFVVAAAVGLSQTFLDLTTTYLRSEALYLFLSLAALLALLRALDVKNRSPLTWLVAAAVLTVAATSVRLAGVALLAVPGLHVVLPGTSGPHRRRALLLVILGLLPLLAWQQRAAQVRQAHPEAPDYGSEFLATEPRDLTKTVRVDNPRIDLEGWKRRIAGNLDVLARANATLLTNVDKAAHRLPVGILLTLVMLLGLTALARGPPAPPGRREVAAYVGATLLLYLAWPFNQQERFYAPLLPILLLAAGEGLGQAQRLARRWTAAPVGRVMVIALAVAVWIALALQHSDQPRVLDRWSLSYALMLALLASGIVAAALWLRRRAWPLVGASACALVLPLFLGPWSMQRFVHTNARSTAFETHRDEHPVGGALETIDVPRVLEDVALFLRDHTPSDALVMTDVPKMMSIMADRRCVPFVYRVHPPDVLSGDADFIYYTGELPEADDALRQCSDRFDVAWEQTVQAEGAERRIVVYARRD